MNDDGDEAPAFEPVYWTGDMPERLEADRADLGAFAPDLKFDPPGGEFLGLGRHDGVWHGRLPVWPFERSQPDGLLDLIPEGLECAIFCSSAHPVLPPTVFPLEPVPDVMERSQHIWHVAGNGSLCLMQSVGAWDPRDRLSDLLMKACGWRIEFELMRRGAITEMTLEGIANNDCLDGVISSAAKETTDIDDQAKPQEPL